MMNVGLPNLGCSDAEFADYDNDDDLDVILVGTYYNTKIYENVNGMYVYVNYGIDNPYAGRCDWGDYDNDGDIDLVMSGRMNNLMIYRNNLFESGVVSFTNTSYFPPLENSDVEWGDYDNDGDLDILVSGESYDYGPNYTKVYNNNNGVFTDINATLVGATHSRVRWLDFDNDGFLDIISGGVLNEATNPHFLYSGIYLYNNGQYTLLMDFPYEIPCISQLDYDNDGDIDIYLNYYYYEGYNILNSTVLLRNEFIPPGPPIVTNAFDQIEMTMNSVYNNLNLSNYFFDSESELIYSFSGNQNINCEITNDSILELTPVTNWYGVEYITIKATNRWNLYVEQVLKVIVYQTGLLSENYNHNGIIPDNWTVQHNGTTTFSWQAFLRGGDNYLMKTMATTGGTANERLFSPVYNLSNYKDIQVSFDSEFLPYGNGTGSFAYTLNNISYTVIETYSTSHSGIKTYSLPALEAKQFVKFRWLYSNSTANTEQSNYWTIDNFYIYGLVRDIEPPIAVSGLSLISQTNHSALLNWNPSSDLYFGKYELYISADDNVTINDQLWSVNQDHNLYFVNTTQTNISPLFDGEYWIAIRAVDQSNNASQFLETIYIRIDNQGPILTDPIPIGQLEPEWSGNREVTIGCSISDLNSIESIQYRIDANGNGTYDETENWQELSRLCSYNSERNIISATTTVEYNADGVLAYEFRAVDIYDNIGYSGISSSEGIDDDWVVRIDTTPPLVYNPVPGNQPQPEWMVRDCVIGCSISDLNTISLIEYRIDINGNGMYDADECWQMVDLSRSNRYQIDVLQPVLFETDGLCHFEFRATDFVGNIGYSGNQNTEDIEDDWIVRIDSTPPVFINPLPNNQPIPEWCTALTITIGATVQDLNSINNLMYRYDANDNGVYDDDETWFELPRHRDRNQARESNDFTVQLTLPGDGNYAFEFKAQDMIGNIGYSGLQGLEGIDDDWIVRIITTRPLFTEPLPDNQPLPAWNNTQQVIIGSSITYEYEIDVNSVKYRIDWNLNGIYDTEEVWQTPISAKSSNLRDNLLNVTFPVSLNSDGVYTFELKATGINGVTGYSGMENLEGIADDWVFRVDTTPPAVINNFFVLQVFDNSIQLSWIASSDLSFAGYRIYYSTIPNVGTSDLLWDSNNDPNLAYSGEGIITTTITGLLPATRYYFSLQAVDEAGWITQYPNIITGMTTSSAPPSSPQNIVLTISGTDIFLDWDDVTTDTMGNPLQISYYEVYVSDQPYFDCNFDTLIGTIDVSEMFLEGASEYAERLFFKVKAISGAITKEIQRR
ncbi:MAG: FG-GAP-like repeat-containing protein [Candidatus Cloacimonas sp.]|nr:FG-GAP-like repeat-containing protein [Candidatus Cloacimonas sp.]